MISVLLQPSLSSTHRRKATGCATSAFFLKALSQSCVMVGFGSDTFARGEGAISLRGAGDCQIAQTHIHTDDLLMHFWCGIVCLNLKTDQQVEALLGLVIPEFGGSDLGTLLDEIKVVVVAGIGDDHPPIQRQDADVLVFLETVVMPKMIGRLIPPPLQRRGILSRFDEVYTISTSGNRVFSGSCALQWEIVSGTVLGAGLCIFVGDSDITMSQSIPHHSEWCLAINRMRTMAMP